MNPYAHEWSFPKAAQCRSHGKIVSLPMEKCSLLERIGKWWAMPSVKGGGRG